MTGEDFCVLVGISYDDIIQLRKKDQEANFDYFISELARIEPVSRALKKWLCGDSGQSQASA